MWIPLSDQEILAWRDAAEITAARTRLEGATVNAIIKRATEIYNVQREEIIGPSRTRRRVRARQYVMYHARMAGRSSLPEIGRRLGGRDHSTVIYGASAHATRHGLEQPWTPHDRPSIDKVEYEGQEPEIDERRKSE